MVHMEPTAVAASETFSIVKINYQVSKLTSWFAASWSLKYDAVMLLETIIDDPNAIAVPGT
jgi:hypothetical protein